MKLRPGDFTWLLVLLLLIFAPGIALLVIIVRIIMAIGGGFRSTKTQRNFHDEMRQHYSDVGRGRTINEADYVEPIDVREIDDE